MPVHRGPPAPPRQKRPPTAAAEKRRFAAVAAAPAVALARQRAVARKRKKVDFSDLPKLYRESSMAFGWKNGQAWSRARGQVKNGVWTASVRPPEVYVPTRTLRQQENRPGSYQSWGIKDGRDWSASRSVGPWTQSSSIPGSADYWGGRIAGVSKPKVGAAVRGLVPARKAAKKTTASTYRAGGPAEKRRFAAAQKRKKK